MRLFGLEIARTGAGGMERSMSPVYDNRGGWWPIVREPYTGAWQRNDEWTVDTVLSHPTVFACITLIADDIAKMRARLVRDLGNDLWIETVNPAFSPVLRRPNRFQNHTQFRRSWIISKLSRGNTYVLKERDDRNVVTALYILDPSRVRPLVTDDGEVYYELNQDNLASVTDSNLIVPASEIIHDRAATLFHPLVGISPLYASGALADLGLKITHNSSAFFGNGSNPGGVLTAPAKIPKETADRLAELWSQKFSGANSGRVAVLGDGLKFEAMRMSAVDSQMIEQTKEAAVAICTAFRVPAFMVNAAPAPALLNAEVLTRQYFTTCLHSHVSDMEAALDEGLGLEETKDSGRLGIALDTGALLQMDTATTYDTLAKGVRGGFLTPNEARQQVDLEPLVGGDTIYMQHQDYPIEKVFDRTDLDSASAPALPAAPEQKLLAPADEGRAAIRAFHVKQRARLIRIANPTRKAA